MHAWAAELLSSNLQPGARVLDVGSGSGYFAAVCAQLVKGQAQGQQGSGKVVGIEYIKPLVDTSIENVKKHHKHFIDDGTIELRHGDGWAGFPSAGPYDAIHVGAAAESVPQALISQLKPLGKMVIPVGKFLQELELVTKDEAGQVHRKPLLSVQYVPLVKKTGLSGAHEGTSESPPAAAESSSAAASSSGQPRQQRG
jgi:protein-L-isoaspartate(D-aspartate) O-methyltransferase